MRGLLAALTGWPAPADGCGKCQREFRSDGASWSWLPVPVAIAPGYATSIALRRWMAG